MVLWLIQPVHVRPTPRLSVNSHATQLCEAGLRLRQYVYSSHMDAEGAVKCPYELQQALK